MFGARLDRAEIQAEDEVMVLHVMITMKTDDQWAANIGVDYGFDEGWSVFAQWARTFRRPNVDERNLTVDGSFDLKTQYGDGFDIGARFEKRSLSSQLTLYTIRNKR